MEQSKSFILQPGVKWSATIKKGKSIKLTATAKGANLAMMLFNAFDFNEKYNMPDTLKAQYTSCLKKGNVLMSDNGRVLASITEDSLGWHDTISGYTTRELTDTKYGKTSYQDQQNEWLRSGQENFMIEMIRNGLTNRDFAPNINLFSKVSCNEKGAMKYHPEHCKENDTVTLRLDMDVLVILSNTPNPNDTSNVYSSVPVKMEIIDTELADLQTDYCANFREENKRAFENTYQYYSLF
ncbi:urea amidolyase associated protein UAAP1 [Flavobacterium sp. 7A]|uniref:urea amidolyase associated protein UAAP1 n=1 Tax=Flavobacterium sp. 7A TaxID=2940571 RepID=UPI002225ED7B|nr:urea amidolyase associated protein UAAP1 [Flavobacterium sp. 7A]MCW2119327.1 urea carboxylase-associated protein 2 [Flavobacterium sp. 7A]